MCVDRYVIFVLLVIYEKVEYTILNDNNLMICFGSSPR